MDPTSNIELFCAVFEPFTHVKIIDTGRDDNISQGKVVAGNSTSDADDKEHLRVQVIDDVVGDLLGGIIALFAAANDSHPYVFSVFVLDLGNSVCSSAWTFLHFARKSLKDGREFVGTNGDNCEIHLCHNNILSPSQFSNKYYYLIRYGIL